MADKDRSPQPLPTSSRQLVDPHGLTRRVSRSHGSINADPSWTRDLKLLIFETSSASTSTASQSSSGASNDLEQVVFQDNGEQFLEKEYASSILSDVDDPPLDHLDHSSFKKKKATAEASTSVVAVKKDSACTVSDMNDRRRGSGPVDLDEIDDETVDGNDSDEPHQTAVFETHRTIPVNADGVAFNDTDDRQQAETLEDGTSRSGDPADLDMLNDHKSGPIDLDAVDDREADFDMIWKEHEDAFFSWKDSKKDGKMATNFGNSSRKRSEEPSAFQAAARGKRDAFVVPVTGIYQDLEKASAAAAKKPQTDDIVSLCSMDTYGFSLAGESLDTYGFSLAENPNKHGFSIKDRDRRVPLSTIEKVLQEDDLTDSIAESFVREKVIPVDGIENSDGCFEEIARVGDVAMINEPAVGSEESRARMIRRINEVLKRQESDSSTVKTPAGTKARGLRAMRLKSRNRAYGAIGGPAFATVHEEEEMVPALIDGQPGSKGSKAIHREEQALTDGNLDTVGLVVQIRGDHADGAQSVVSEISTLSDKLWLKAHPKAGSKWEDLSSVGLNGVEGRPVENEDAILATPHDGLTTVGEAEGHDVEAPPIYYDSSVKTPPFLFYETANSDALVDGQDDVDSKWDDVSSIGLTGVECLAIRKKADEKPREENGIEKQNKENCRDNAMAVERSSNANSIFRNSKNEDHHSEKPSKIPDIDMKPTFSTVWDADSDISGSIASLEPDDLERNIGKEVSSTSAPSSDTKNQVSLRWNSRFLTSPGWWIVLAISVLAVTAICIVVVYVYVSL